MLPGLPILLNLLLLTSSDGVIKNTQEQNLEVGRKLKEGGEFFA